MNTDNELYSFNHINDHSILKYVLDKQFYCLPNDQVLYHTKRQKYKQFFQVFSSKAF